MRPVREPVFVCEICDQECKVVNDSWQNLDHAISNRSVCCSGPVHVVGEEGDDA